MFAIWLHSPGPRATAYPSPQINNNKKLPIWLTLFVVTTFFAALHCRAGEAFHKERAIFPILETGGGGGGHVAGS